MVTPEFPPNCGGIGSYVFNLSKNLVQRGHNISVFTRGYWNHEYVSTDFEGIHVYRIRYAPIHPFSMQFHGIFLNKIFKKYFNCYDLVHIHNPIVPILKVSCPTIITQHGLLINDIENTEVTDLNSLFARILEKWFVCSEINTINNSKIITTVSESCAAEMKTEYKINKAISVIQNGVDTDFFIPKERTNEGYILYTGRLHGRKGLLDLIDCAKYVTQKNPSIKFVITGEGPLRDSIMERIKKLDLEDNITLTGFVDKNQLLHYYQNASMYILPSYYEGLPTSLLEAMSCGIPCIATNIAGNSELIKNEQTGLLISPRNPKKLSESIIRLLSDAELREKLGTNSRNYILENYDWEIITNKIIKCYEKALYNKI